MPDIKFDHSFFQNTHCKYFPCHTGVAKENFSCLFCYCPLYALGKACGGAFTYNEEGMKDCSRCTIPHRRENYDRILSRYPDVLKVIKTIDRENALFSPEIPAD